jgi:hypothetical protein
MLMIVLTGFISNQTKMVIAVVARRIMAVFTAFASFLLAL